MKKRILSLVLVVVMMFTLLPMCATADSIVDFMCGLTLTWKLDDGVLTLIGRGSMWDYKLSNVPPWYFSSNRITEIVLPEGITTIGNYAFSGCVNLTSVDIPDSVTRIGNMAFSGCTNLTSIEMSENVTRIGEGAFIGCSNLSDVYYGKDKAQWDKITIDANNTSLQNAAIHYGKVVLEISGQPEDVEAEEEQDVSFGVAIEGNELTYQWQYKMPDTDEWININSEDAKGSELTVKATASANKQQYRCVVTDAFGNTAISDAATLKVNLLEITSQPESVAAFEGEYVNFSVAAKGKDVTYQWQYKLPDGSTWSTSGTTGAKTPVLTVKATEARDGQQYRCIIKEAGGRTVTSDAVKLTLKPFVITAQPESVMAEDGTNAVFSVAAEGRELSYQWQYKKAGEDAWYASTLSGAKTAELTVKATDARDGQQYRCIVKDANGKSLTSDAAELTIAPDIIITSQPQSKTIKEGKSASFKVEAHGNDITYQWQYKGTNVNVWVISLSSGSTTSELTVKAKDSRDGRQYRCVITDANGNTVNSEPATLTIVPKLEITSQPAGVTIEAGKHVTFSVAANETDVTYQWQYRLNSESEWKTCSYTGSNTPELTVLATILSDGQQFRCVVTDSDGDTVTSNAATLSIGTALAITSQPENMTAEAGGTASFRVTAAGENLSYQWQYRNPNGNVWVISLATGSTTPELTVKVKDSRDGRQYRCIVTDGNGNTVTSEAGTLTIAIPLAISAQPESVIAEVGETATFSVKAEGNGLTYQWQYKTPTGSKWNTSSSTGAKTDSLSIQATEARNGQQYRCVVTDANGKTLTSDAATLMVAVPVVIPEIISQPKSVTTEAGETAYFSVEAQGNGLSYQWQYKTPTGTKWNTSTSTGAKTAKLSIQATEARNGQQYRCVITCADGNTMTSDAATLNVGAVSGAIVITSQPESVTANAGEMVSFSVMAEGDGLTYQWQYKTPTGSSWNTSSSTGAKTASLSIQATNARNGQQYRCVVTDANGNSVSSNAAMITVSK